MLGVRNPEHGMDPRFVQKHDLNQPSESGDLGMVFHMMIVASGLHQLHCYCILARVGAT